MKSGNCFRQLMLSALMVLTIAAVSGCASTKSVNFRVHSEPEGAHVVYRQNSNSWIYLGVTPLDAIEVISDERFESQDTYSIKVMRCGYLDQEKDWSGEALEREFDEKGLIFWTPRMIKNVE